MPVSLRDYQEEAIAFLLSQRRGLIHAPAGSGKTLIAAGAVARKAWPGCRVGWLANTIEQCQQAVKAIESTPGAQGVEFTICCAAAEPDFSLCGIIVLDECHHTPAVSWMRVLYNTKAIVWGFSATPDSEDALRNEVMSFIFAARFCIDRARLEAAGHLEKGKVYIHDLDTEGEFNPAIDAQVAVELKLRIRRFPYIPVFEHERRIKWQITQEFVQKNENRNNAITKISSALAKDGRSVLLLVQSIEHGNVLVAGLPGALLVHSKLSKKARAAAIGGFRCGELSILAATSLADEGLDVPRASVLVLAAGGRAAGKLEQRAGRVLRPFANKQGGVIHDFLDRGATFARAQSNARMRVYDRLGYEPEIVTYK